MAAPRAAHQQGFGGAFAAGLRRHGVTVEILPAPAPCDLLVLWGVRQRGAIERQKAAGCEVCILERGYVGDRFAWTSVSFGGGLNGRGEFRGPVNDRSRWDRHFAGLMRPWRRQAGYALIMGQVPTDAALRGLNPMGLWNDVAARLREQGREVRFRPHPKAPGLRLRGIPLACGGLDDALTGASVVATINSNSGVDAVLAGVPTVALDAGSMAWSVAAHEVGEIVTPDREAWAAQLAWCQWTLDELGSGFCWEMVGHG